MVLERGFDNSLEREIYNREFLAGRKRIYRTSQLVIFNLSRKLYNEYITFKSSMLSLLCYIYLCKREWIKTVRYAEQYHQFEKQYQFHAKNSVQQKIHYNVLTFQTEAYCELNRIEKAYEKLQDTIGVVDYT